MPIAEMLNILVCPACHASLTLLHAPDELVCTGCHRAYPIEDDIPVLLIDRARIRH